MEDAGHYSDIEAVFSGIPTIVAATPWNAMKIPDEGHGLRWYMTPIASRCDRLQKEMLG